MGGEVQRGTLYIISTPIGNLEDITLRAVRVLAEVDLIAAEDTRKTGVLLRHIGLQKRMVSYHGHNERTRIPYLLSAAAGGSSVGVVTDAGTPGISDPAYALIRAAIERNIPVVPVPGPTALVPALVISGLPADRFAFEGFLPVKKGREKRLLSLRSEERTLVFYESPHRLPRTLVDLLRHFGERETALVRELTKAFEEVLRGTLSEMIEILKTRPPRGEYVIVVAGKQKGDSRQTPQREG